MSATNENKGFTVPKGPREKLTVDEAKKRHQDNLKAMQLTMAELTALLDGLEELVA